MALSPDIKERIFAAADQLHAASETGEFPSVEAVRQLSRAGMNNVVEAMKEWRQQQRKQVQTVREPMPAALQAVLQDMGQNLWATAQQLANESLEAAKAAFEAEKADLIELSEQQSEAFDTQAAELERMKTQALDAAQAHQDATERAAAELAAVRAELAQALTRAERAEANLAEQRQAAQDAATERDSIRAELVKTQATIEAERKANQEQQQNTAAELAAMRAELNQERKATAEAREKAAGLAGQLEATQAQASALLARLDKPEAKPATTRKKEPKA
ncbi:hypothetical protein JQY81_004731 [Salmonella enterica]|nr:hypothetical protein [Salmonella enterica]